MKPCIRFRTGNWPNKKEILEHCDRVSWTEFLKISSMRDYKSIERALPFYHRASSIGEITEYKKMLAVLEGTKSIFIPPQVDTYPEIILNEVLKSLAKKYEGVFVHGEFDPTETATPIKELLDSPERLPRLSYLETTDDKLKILQVSDLPFTYYLGPKNLVSELIKAADLEGFFCDSETAPCWADEEVPSENQITWAEDSK